MKLNFSFQQIVTDSVLFIDGKKVDWSFHESLLDDEVVHIDLFTYQKRGLN